MEYTTEQQKQILHDLGYAGNLDEPALLRVLLIDANKKIKNIEEEIEYIRHQISRCYFDVVPNGCWINHEHALNLMKTLSRSVCGKSLY